MFYITNRKALMNAHRLLTEKTIHEIEAVHNEPLHAHLTQVELIGFLSAVILLVIHHPLREATGMPLNTAMAALIPAGFALLALCNDDRRKTLLKVDSESILFFAGLFALIGGREKIKLFESLADGLAYYCPCFGYSSADERQQFLALLGFQPDRIFLGHGYPFSG